MNTRLFIHLAFLFAFMNVKAQPPYIEKIVNVCFEPAEDSWPVAFHMVDNRVYVGNSWTANSDDGRIYLIKTDTLGSLEFVNPTISSCINILSNKTNIISTPDNIYLVGRSNSYDGGIEGFHGPYDCTVPGTPLIDFLLVKSEKTGVDKFAKCYGGQGQDSPCNIFLSPTENSVVLLGTVTIASSGDYVNPLSPVNGQDMWLVEVDTTDGGIVREKCFGTATGNETMYNSTPTKDKGFLLTGTTSFYPNNLRDAILIKVDSLWNEEWIKILPTPKIERGALVLEDTLTGSIYWLINSDETDSIFHTTYYNTLDPWEDNFNNWLVKLNSNGDTLWTKLIGTQYSERFIAGDLHGNQSCSLIFNKQHEIVIISNSQKAHNGQSVGYDIFFTKLDTSGNILTQKKLPEFEMLNDIIPLDNDRYLCLARMFNNNNCPYQLVTLGNTVGLEEQALNPIKIFPNPAEDFVSIELPQNYTKAQLTIYNLTGQLVSQKQLTQSSQQLPVSELGNGMYIFVIQNGDRVIGRQRVAISH